MVAIEGQKWAIVGPPLPKSGYVIFLEEVYHSRDHAAVPQGWSSSARSRFESERHLHRSSKFEQTERSFE